MATEAITEADLTEAQRTTLDRLSRDLLAFVSGNEMWTYDTWELRPGFRGRVFLHAALVPRDATPTGAMLLRVHRLIEVGVRGACKRLDVRLKKWERGYPNAVYRPSTHDFGAKR